ncbi:hypothetical protein A2Z00_03640 [Candidatus Gottesmanbacteria bacterium RBG_13_45_10]|uniref:Uncharacterized protein n=1 Tax=Candidatus Gottesmanbacteria bacterium RBG_13_45_10 TaxID=1798370 RepID=A0A1F5ZGZ7_9BACT|nr:MAG: hypothetical protein A2Z00_03640 [Candidatus Gottesmanbacteria bacterium RBG_13_45_10]
MATETPGAPVPEEPGLFTQNEQIIVDYINNNPGNPTRVMTWRTIGKLLPFYSQEGFIVL